MEKGRGSEGRKKKSKNEGGKALFYRIVNGLNAKASWGASASSTGIPRRGRPRDGGPNGTLSACRPLTGARALWERLCVRPIFRKP